MRRIASIKNAWPYTGSSDSDMGAALNPNDPILYDHEHSYSTYSMPHSAVDASTPTSSEYENSINGEIDDETLTLPSTPISYADDDLLHGGIADNKGANEFDQDELNMGIQVEMEHTDDLELAKEIAMDHLVEIPDYYSRLLNMENEAKKELTSAAKILHEGGFLISKYASSLQIGSSILSVDKNSKLDNVFCDYDVINSKAFGDIRYANLGRKFDAFHIFDKIESSFDYQLALENIYAHLRPQSFGYIKVASINIDVDKLSNMIRQVGFNIKNADLNIDDSMFEFFVEKSENDKIASVEISDSNGKICAEFVCDIASSHKEKIDGLQVYARLNSNAGLLFEYKKPQDVLYHMGSVAYPIDIIFIDKSGSIKKIANNIQPNTIGTFGCAQVKYVLEIPGGASDLIGLSTSHIVSIDRGISSNTLQSIDEYGTKAILTYPSNKKSASTALFGGTSVLQINHSDAMEKFASTAVDIISQSHTAKKLIAINFDEILFSKESSMRLYYATDKYTDSDKLSLSYDGKARMLCKNAFDSEFIDINTSEAIDDVNCLNNMSCCAIAGLKNSLSNMMQLSSENLLNLKKISAMLNNSESKLIFVTNSEKNLNMVHSLISNKLAPYIKLSNLIDSDIIRVNPLSSDSECANYISEKYSNDNVSYIKISDAAKKVAGIPVPDEIKNLAKQAQKSFVEAQQISEDLLSNFEKNVSEYEKNTGNLQAIANSKGEYVQSCKRNAGIAKKLLLAIRAGIKVMNEIKDISTTAEIIDSLALSSKLMSENAEAVFDLVNKIESADFFVQLTDATTKFSKSNEDLQSNLQRMIQYIDSNVLGLLVISR